MAIGTKLRIVLTRGRLAKGLLAFSRKFQRLFPPSAGKVPVFLDDNAEPLQKPYTPYTSSTRECRIYNLKQWLRQHKATVGDWVEVTVEERGYRLRFLRRSEEEAKYRQQLGEAETEQGASDALRRLAQVQRRPLRKVAIKELERLSRQERLQRRRVQVAPRERYEGVPANLRVLLKVVYEGRCQICGFTFRKRNGEPYFEVHHVEPAGGHHPKNLLVLCPNCHAQMEHAEVQVKRDSEGWVVAVIINGEERGVNQALARKKEKILVAHQSLFTWLAFAMLGSNLGIFVA